MSILWSMYTSHSNFIVLFRVANRDGNGTSFSNINCIFTKNSHYSHLCWDSWECLMQHIVRDLDSQSKNQYEVLCLQCHIGNCEFLATNRAMLTLNIPSHSNRDPSEASENIQPYLSSARDTPARTIVPLSWDMYCWSVSSMTQHPLYYHASLEV